MQTSTKNDSPMDLAELTNKNLSNVLNLHDRIDSHQQKETQLLLVSDESGKPPSPVTCSLIHTSIPPPFLLQLPVFNERATVQN